MDQETLEVFVRFHFLHWARCVAMLGPIPIFGEGVGARVGKLGLGIMLGSIFALNSGMGEFADPGFGMRLFLCLANEALLGILFGFVANIAFSAIRIAGHLIGTEMGFSMASIQDPITGVNVQVVAHIIESFSFLLFFAVGGHHTLLRALYQSFDRYRVGELGLSRELIEAVVIYSSGIFAAAFQLAAPIFVAMILTGVSLAILAKLAPQLQIMQFAFSFKILAGIMLILATLPTLVASMHFIFDRGDQFFLEITSP
ncbi:MAG: flagellar biosynthetic protein FliR [Planctomycetota bacterium]